MQCIWHMHTGIHACASGFKYNLKFLGSCKAAQVIAFPLLGLTRLHGKMATRRMCGHARSCMYMHVHACAYACEHFRMHFSVLACLQV